MIKKKNGVKVALYTEYAIKYQLRADRLKKLKD